MKTEILEVLEKISLDAVPVLCTDRCVPRKEQAALARKLFKQLGIKGVSVVTPRYSMASVVEVSVPKVPVNDAMFMFEGKDYRFHSYSDMPLDVPVKKAVAADREAANLVERILAKAFPNHDDRSDSQTDYYDRCWTVD